MKKSVWNAIVLVSMGIALISCNHPDDVNKPDTLAAWMTVREDLPVPSDWTESWTPGFSALVILYNDNTCMVQVGFNRDVNGERPYMDREDLVFRTTDTGYSLYDNKSKEVQYTLTLSDNESVVMEWSHSTGPIWDQYAEWLAWPKEITLWPMASCDILE